MVIKPSGLAYDELTPESMVVCDLHGEVVEGDRAPSSDTAAHAYVYKHMPEVGGVVHTHSTYATAWAARGEPIPCVLTMIADEFGGDIPVGPFALIGDDSVGRGIVETLSGHRSPAVLMKNHGVFTIGATAMAAVKAAVMCEDVARTVHIARQIGQPLADRAVRCRLAFRPLPAASTANVDRSPDRWRNTMTAGVLLLVPHRKPGPLRSETLQQVERNRSRSSINSMNRGSSRCPCNGSPC